MTDILETIQRDSLISFPFLGDWFINPPSSFTLFGRTIYIYGVVVALAFLLAIIWLTKNCKRFGILENDLYDAIIWAIPLGIIGARLYYVLFSLDYYKANPSKIIAIWEGGLAIYGGIIAGILVIFFLCRHKKMRVAAMLDLVICGVIIGQIIGRWGNFFNREAFGTETTVFCRMGLTSPDGNTIYVHPTFLYESLWNLALFIFLCIFIKKGKRKYNGQIMLIYLFVYGIGRTLIEGLRTDSLYIGGTGIRVSQLLSALLVIFAGVMLIYNGKRVKNGTLKLEPPYLETGMNEEDAAEDTADDQETAADPDEKVTEEPSADDSDDDSSEDDKDGE
ncbi:MAG: prolipoprotein diacylglyceryl transferase [Oscillospiraceae bacterium]|nr:prolipoprotein diacylglyceryl transferase [Oscillospiraceae bacterium]